MKRTCRKKQQNCIFSSVTEGRLVEVDDRKKEDLDFFEKRVKAEISLERSRTLELVLESKDEKVDLSDNSEVFKLQIGKARN